MTARLTTFTALIIALFMTVQLGAVDLHPDLKEKLIREGKYDEYVASMKDARARGVCQPAEHGKHLMQTLSQNDGPDTVKAVVLLVEFSDNLANNPGDPYNIFATQQYFDSLVNSVGYTDSLPLGSMREFYLENSHGQFVLTADVYGWIMMPQKYEFYVDGQRGFGTHPQNAQGLVEDAVSAADPLVDFSEYDNDGDGVVEGLIVVHAGPGYEETGDTTMIHSHKWFVNQTTLVDDVYISAYNCNPEESRPFLGTPSRIQIGVFCHEFGHTLGLPDLYDYDYGAGASQGMGNWSLMASGSYNGNSASPAHFDAWCKYFLGWIDPVEITESVRDYEFEESFTSGFVAKLWRDGNYYGPEYFLIENRQKKGFDKYIPGEGLMIYHIDETNWGNDDEYNYLVALEQADGEYDLEENRNQGDSQDPYPGSLNIREFSEMTMPNTLENRDSTILYPDTDSAQYVFSYDSTYVAVWDISDSDSLMYASLDVNYTRPRFELIDYQVSEVSGDGDEDIEPGETFGLGIKVANYRAPAGEVRVHTTFDLADIVIADTIRLLGDHPSLDTLDNFADPIEFSIPDGIDPTITVMNFMVVDSAHTDSVSASMQFNVGNPRVLIVDHDGTGPKEYEHFYTDIFDSLKIPYVLYERNGNGTPSEDYLTFPVIIWFVTADTSQNSYLESSDIQFLKDYMDSGGKLFLTGQNIAEYLSSGPDSLFLKNYLKCSYEKSGRAYFDVKGYDDSQIGYDTLWLQIHGWDGSFTNNSMDVLKDVAPEAQPSLYYISNDGVAAVEYDGSYKLAFWGFGFEGITSASPIKDTRVTAMTRVLDFLDNIVTDVEDEIRVGEQLPKSFSLEQNYPNPFNPTTVISFNLQKGVSNASLEVYNILGRQVKTLVDGPLDAGRYTVTWDGRDDGGNAVASGVYFYRLRADEQVEAKKMLLMK